MIIGGKKLRIGVDDRDGTLCVYYYASIINQDESIIRRGNFRWVSEDEKFVIESASIPQIVILPPLEHNDIPFIHYYIRGTNIVSDHHSVAIPLSYFRYFRKMIEEFNDMKRKSTFKIMVIGEN